LQVLEFIHFGCTSEDINNLAHALMLKEAMNAVIFPVMDDLIQAICNKAKDNAHISMLSRTHGQVICYILHGLLFMHYHVISH
jgi:adenylosuccinate lyase